MLPLPLQKSLILWAMSESGGGYQLSFPEKGGLIREGAYLKGGGGGLIEGLRYCHM